ncbi:MAG: DUF2304 domain-containing protein [Prolixibacteraceae bacterium]|nr:DUF2304 domain-containing protein [Prolixibacteraceae bacterium]MBN2648933.1 DUF2304 domain-containing protein [Prolixibacteraceae bacterium]
MDRIQLISIIISVTLFIFVFNLVRKRRLKTEYSLIWLIVATVFIIFSFWKYGIDWLAGVMGIAYAPSVLFLMLLFGIVMLLIEFSLIISKQAEKIKILSQELGLMKQDLEQKIEKINSKTDLDNKQNETSCTENTK